MMGRCGDWCGGMFSSGFGFGWIFTIIIWALIIWAIVSFFRAASGRGRDGNYWHMRDRKDGDRWTSSEKMDERDKEDSAVRILRERFAKGEITREEYEQKRKDMENMK